jgi:hypothetical protein
MIRMIFAALVVGALFLPASAWAVNIVANGGFETGTFAAWTRSGNLEFTSAASRTVHSGTYAASFGPTGSLGFIAQSLPTVAGEGYVLSFWLQNNGGTPNQFDAYWAGSTVASFVDMAAQGYTQYSYDLIALTTSTELKFGFRNDPRLMHFDDVSVESAVPEPGAFQLTMIGAAMIFAAGRFRRRRG